MTPEHLVVFNVVFGIVGVVLFIAEWLEDLGVL